MLTLMNVSPNSGRGVSLYLIYASWCGYSKNATRFRSLIADYDGTTMNGVTLNIKNMMKKIVLKEYDVKGCHYMF